MILAGPPDRRPTPGAATRPFGTWRRHRADQTVAVEVDIPSCACDEISRVVAGRQAAEDTGLLFLSDEGRGIHYSHFRLRGWLKARATLPDDRQLRMGHSSITMTLDRCGHLLDQSEAAVVEAMASPFLPVAPAEESRHSNGPIVVAPTRKISDNT